MYRFELRKSSSFRAAAPIFSPGLGTLMRQHACERAVLWFPFQILQSASALTFVYEYAGTAN
jgi:hypothetical protein